jgi:hypothetical protein
MKKIAVCMARDRAEVEAIVARLLDVGFWDSDISVLFPHKEDTVASAAPQHGHSVAGALTGAGAGGVAAGTFGLLAGLGVLAIPGLGPFLAAGPLLGALTGAIAGAGFGGVGGYLVGLGIPDNDAKRYEAELRNGKPLISVHFKDQGERELAESVFAEFAAAPATVMRPHIESPRP